MDWDSAVQKELYGLKLELKEKDTEIQKLKQKIRRERDRCFFIERSNRQLKEEVRYWKRKEKALIDKEREEKEREEAIRKEVN